MRHILINDQVTKILTSSNSLFSKVFEQTEHLTLAFGVVGVDVRVSIFTAHFSKFKLKLLRKISLSHGLLSYTIDFGNNLKSFELLSEADTG